MKIQYFLLLIILFSCSFNINQNIEDTQRTTQASQDTNQSEEKTFEFEVENLNTTFVAPHIYSGIHPSKNTIYCASFEISWNKIRDEILGEPFELDTNIEWVNILNDEPINKTINPGYVYANAGYGSEDILLKIQKDLKSKFNYNYSPNYHLNETDIFSIAYLKKDVKFFKELNESFGNEELLFNDSINVEFFGLKHGWANPMYKKQLMIHDYQNDDDFIFQMGTRSRIDEVYFAKVNPGKTIFDTYESVMERVEKGNLTYLELDEQLKIPFIRLNVNHEFKEVAQAKLLNKGFETYRVGKAFQLIDFNLNERGITLESVAESYILEAVAEEIPRQLVFDKPFMIILKEKGKSRPYFLLWVNNAEFMRVKNY